MNPDEQKTNYWENPQPEQPVQPAPQPVVQPVQPAPTTQSTQPVEPQTAPSQPTTQPGTPIQPELITENAVEPEYDQPEYYEETPPQAQIPDNPVTWTAHEYVHIDKTPIWFVLFVIVVLALIAFDLFVLKSYTFSALVVVMAIAVVIYIRRPPRELTYTLSAQQGLYVGEHLYVFEDFKSFGLIKDGEHNSIMLIPTKRFAPGVSVYFPEEAGEEIVDILGQRLPMEELKLDVIDIVVRKLRL